MTATKSERAHRKYVGRYSAVFGGDQFESEATDPIYHGSYYIYTAPHLLLDNLTRPPGLDLGAYNISDAWGFGLAQAIWEVQLGNCDLIMLAETKISDKAYCHNQLG